MDPRNELLEYWKNPTDENHPLRYVGGIRQGDRSKFLVGVMKKYVSGGERILELGCNVGRNLWYLANAGYGNLHGIEINPKAIKIGKSVGAHDIIKYYKGTILDRLMVLKSFDVIFSVAVLMHMHPDEWEKVKPLMASIAQSYIITFESEVDKEGKLRNIGRNYRKEFEDLGFYQVEEHKDVPGLSKAYKARVLKKE
jgi:2-polyprenyl-3-methyl-5-hydroxy-6-metoxy-1,4-benzoquinol methylase